MSLSYVVCFRTVKQKSIQFVFGFRLKGLFCEGTMESPILHLRLLEPHETFEEDEEKLKEVVALVSYLCCLLIENVFSAKTPTATATKTSLKK